METTEIWVQAAMFPEFPLVFWAYEFEAMGGRWWEIHDDSGFLEGIEPDDFGDFLDFARSINYDVKVNTYESWVLMEEWG